MQSLKNKSILLVITGGIAAYKSLELIRLIRKAGGTVRCVLTKGGEQFVTPMSVSALCEHPCYTDLFSLKDEAEMGHIRLSREADVIVVAPASADFIAKMAHGYANDLASTTLLAADKPILFAPAMNHMMWENPATQDNVKTLINRGMTQIGPDEGNMACGEFGFGRMSEPETILKAITEYFAKDKPLAGKTALVTSGPTYEPLDPVRFIGNRSSGKQGHAIAAALADAGADVTLVTGPVSIPDPSGVHTVHVETASQMLKACETALPYDIAICAAAVSDWSADASEQKIKKSDGAAPPSLKLTENPDILAIISKHAKRPQLVIGFAAETNNLIEAAKAKLQRKECDFILANDVNSNKNVFGSDENHVYLIGSGHEEDWQKSSKKEVARRLANFVVCYLAETAQQTIAAE